MIVEFHHTTKPDAETREGRKHNKNSDGNTIIYYRTSQQLASGKHGRPTRNSTSIITSPNITNINKFRKSLHNIIITPKPYIILYE
jgi:hypothetical protein